MFLGEVISLIVVDVFLVFEVIFLCWSFVCSKRENSLRMLEEEGEV